LSGYDLIEFMKRKQTPRFWIFFVLVIAVIPFLVSKLGDKIEKARETEANELLSGLLTAENTYFSQHKEYTSDYSKLSFVNLGQSRCNPILKKEDIMDVQFTSWPEECLPFLNKDTFRASCLVDLGKKTVCFSINEKGLFQKFERTLEVSSEAEKL
jgi:hypothetical protein